MIPYILVAAMAFALKLHYSRASADQLAWILKPTAVLVEKAIGIEFKHAAGSGYISREHRIIIAPSCAGVNFLIMAFCMSAFSFLHEPRLRRIKFLWIGFCGLASYLLALFVNTVRITLAIYLYKYSVSWGWFTPERIHRIEGIVVYLLFLSVFYLVIQKTVSRAKNQNEKKLRSSPGERYILNPWSWYLVMTLGVPFLNAAFLKNPAGFLEHAATILLVGLFLAGILHAAGKRLLR